MDLQVGSPAPDFDLRNQHGESVALQSLRGKKALVVFYPFAFSQVCGGELSALRESRSDFVNDDVVTVAVSVDHFFAQRAWSDREDFGFDLLSDYWPHGAVARAYGVFNDEVGCADRGTFVLDRDGVLRWQVRTAIPDARSLDDYRSALAAID